MNPDATDTRPHVVVLGGGFGGLTFCQSMKDAPVRITLVDRQNHHLFQPLLYQVATAGLAAPDIAQPIRSILSRQRNVTILMGEVTGVDLASRRVRLDHGELSYDWLVIALGAVTSYFGHPEWGRHAVGLKTIDDAREIRQKVLLNFERAEVESDEGERRRLMTMVVVGAGPTGLEVAGALVELCRHVLRRDFRRIDPAKAHVVLVEAAPRVLPSFPADLSASAERQLRQIGVEVRTGSPVRDLQEGRVVLDEGQIETGAVVWAAGIEANPVTASLGVPLDRSGRIEVRPDFSLPGHPEVFAIGDLVALTDPKGQKVPALSPGAMQGARYLARIIRREVRPPAPGGAPERAPFTYFDKGLMATIGRSKAVAVAPGGIRFSGWLAWMAWLLVHLIFLIGLRNKYTVFSSWVYSYITYGRGARIVTVPVPPPRPAAVLPAGAAS